jgi:uncharacterized protein YjgD (DUF1641 family)
MGQPIPFRPEKNGHANAEHLRNAPAEHAEALLSAYELLQVLHDKGVLNLLRGLVAAGDELIATITAAVDTQESIRAIRNIMMLTRLLSSIPPEALHSLIENVRTGAARETSHRAPSLLRLLWRLRDENSRHAAAVGLDLLQGLGKAL